MPILPRVRLLFSEGRDRDRSSVLCNSALARVVQTGNLNLLGIKNQIASLLQRFFGESEGCYLRFNGGIR